MHLPLSAAAPLLRQPIARGFDQNSVQGGITGVLFPLPAAALVGLSLPFCCPTTVYRRNGGKTSRERGRERGRWNQFNFFRGASPCVGGGGKKRGGEKRSGRGAWEVSTHLAPSPPLPVLESSSFQFVLPTRCIADVA